MKRRLSALLLIFPSFVFAHGGDPRVVGFRFPSELGDEVWILVDNRGVFARRDGQFRWLCDDAIVPSAGFNGLALAAPPGEVLVATGNAGLFRSDDSGCSFARNEGALTDHVTEHLLPHPVRREELLVTTSTLGLPNDVFLSEDGGRNWSAAGLDSEGRIRSIVRSHADPEVVYTTHFRGASRSDDGGRTFVDLALGPEGMDVRPEEFDLLATDPNDAQTAYASIARFPDSMLVRTTDGGASWEVLVTLPDVPDSMVMDAGGGRLLITSAFEGMWRSNDGGETWDPLAGPAPNMVVGCLHGEPDSDRVWACGRSFSGPVWVVGSTDDLGDTWRPEMVEYLVQADPWPCPVDSPSRETCEMVCLPEDPACIQDRDSGPDAGPATDGGGPSDASSRDTDSTENDPDGAAAEQDLGDDGCGAVPSTSALPSLLLLGRRRRRRR